MKTRVIQSFWEIINGLWSTSKGTRVLNSTKRWHCPKHDHEYSLSFKNPSIPLKPKMRFHFILHYYILPAVMEMKFSCGISWKLITCNFSIVTMHQWSSLTCLLQMCLGKIFKYFWTYPPFWKHATNGMFNNSFRNSVLQLGKCLLCHTTRSSRVPPINLLGPLFPSYSNLLCIYLPIKIIKRFRLFIVYMKVMKLCMS